MAIPGLNFLSTFFKGFQPRRENASPHSMLAGLKAELFLRQWGAPEVKTTLGQIEAFFKLHRPGTPDKSNLLPQENLPRNAKLESRIFIPPSLAQGPISVWIYKKMDRILFFRGDKLISHFKWSQFKKSLEPPSKGTEPGERQDRRDYVPRSGTVRHPRPPSRMAVVCL